MQQVGLQAPWSSVHRVLGPAKALFFVDVSSVAVIPNCLGRVQKDVSPRRVALLSTMGAGGVGVAFAMAVAFSS